MTADPFATAAARQLARDALWKNRPPLDPACDHDLLCLLTIEARQTVICRTCGGRPPGHHRTRPVPARRTRPGAPAGIRPADHIRGAPLHAGHRHPGHVRHLRGDDVSRPTLLMLLRWLFRD